MSRLWLKNSPTNFTIEKLLPSGEGLGHFEKWPVFVYGALPGEEVLAEFAKKRKRSIKATILKVLKPSSDRREPKDNHFYSSSPFQMIPENLQHEFKKKFVLELFDDNAHFIPQTPPELISDNLLWHYRNKMEYSFTKDPKGNLSLALHKRNRKHQYYLVEYASIAHEKINECATLILDELRQRNIDAKQLKTLVLRYSYFEDICIAALYVKDPNFVPFELNDIAAGWHILYSDSKSPASVKTNTLHTQDRETLIEKLGGNQLEYYYDGFFQIHPPCFEKILSFIKQNIQPGGTLLDLYSGVGTIGFALAKKFDQVIGIEFDERASQAALRNIGQNQLENVQLFSGAAEKQGLREFLREASTLVVDPPRCGLHPKVIKRILETPPKHFIYVSCNPNTQAQDFALLQAKYTVDSWKLFDLYPQTPHIESVLILNKKKEKNS